MMDNWQVDIFLASGMNNGWYGYAKDFDYVAF